MQDNDNNRNKYVTLEGLISGTAGDDVVDADSDRAMKPRTRKIVIPLKIPPKLVPK